MRMSFRLSIRLSHSCVTPQQFKISKCFSHHSTERRFQFADARFHRPFRGSPQTSALKDIEKLLVKWSIIHSNLETVHTGFLLVPKSA